MLNLLKSECTYNDVVILVSFECQKRGVIVEDYFVRAVISSVLLNPDNSFTLKRLKEKEELERLVHLSVEALNEETSNLNLGILKFQHFMSNTFGNRGRIIKEFKEKYYAHLEPLINSIIQLVPGNELNINALNRRIVLGTILLSGLGLGNPSKPSVYKEVSASLRSVFNTKDLEAFVELSSQEKLQKLESLASIVAGIRIFEAEKGVSGEVENIPAVVEDACTALLEKTEALIGSTSKEIERLTSFIGKFYSWERAPHPILFFQAPKNMSKEVIEQGKYLLALLQQFKCFLIEIVADTIKCRRDLRIFEGLMAEVFLLLNNTTKGRMAVPTNIVFPQFSRLSQLWTEFQGLMIVINSYNKIVEGLHDIVKNQDNPCIWKKVKESEGMDSSAVVTGFCAQAINPSDIHNCNIVYPPLEEGIKLEYNGLCAVHAIEGDGLVVEGDVRIGVLQYKSKYYSFKDVDAACIFGRDPEWYIRKVVDFSRRHPEFLDLFRTREEVNKVKFLGAQVVELRKPGKLDKWNQTELHPIDINLDPNYCWNMWDIKKEIVKMANIVGSRTRSSQTPGSQFRGNVGTQTFWKKSQGCSTRRDGWTECPKEPSCALQLVGPGGDRPRPQLLFAPPIESGGFLRIVTPSAKGKLRESCK